MLTSIVRAGDMDGCEGVWGGELRYWDLQTTDVTFTLDVITLRDDMYG
jgi:hypothetical protein